MRYSRFLLFLLTLSVAGATRPNIVGIMVDDMGFSDLGCYGSEIRTPHLDSLAKGGIRYTQMTNTAKCWTTRISLLTGLYHIRSDRDFANSALAGQVLRPAGYHTWWSGKHHAGFNPYERGFDHFSGFLGGAINFWNPGNAARPGEPKPGWGASYSWAFDDSIVKPYVPDSEFYATDRFTDWALEWVNGQADDKPFFLYLAYNAPHWPLHAHPEDIARYKGVYDGGYQAIREARYTRQIESGLFDKATTPLPAPDAQLNWDALSPEQRADESMRMAIHAAMVDRVDQNVGRLVRSLREKKKLDNTLILFLVDNGASHERPGRGAPKEPWGSVGTFQAIGKDWSVACNTPLRYWKTSSHEGGICTPMIAHWPAGIRKPGRIYRENCHLVDLLPTWMELAGEQASYPADIPPPDGISIVPSFRDEPLAREKPLAWQYGGGRAIRDGNWKLVYSRGWRLYDLAKDRCESNDLSTAQPERVKTMTARWHAWYESCTGTPFKEPPKKSKKRNP
ncbi:MAG: arylsulfatase A-like enzyme [Rhodothermales bacterium]|jgi:arylsulfatase A-like enzyme